MERMQKRAGSLNIQLRFTVPSSSRRPARPDAEEQKRNRAIKRRHIAEKVAIVRPLSPVTTVNPKAVVKMPDVKAEEPARNDPKLLFERAQERIKKLKDRKMMMKPATTESSAYKTLQVVNAVEEDVPRSSPQPLRNVPVQKRQRKRQDNMFGFGFGDGLMQLRQLAGSGDPSVFQPLDFVPLPVRQFVPNVVPNMFMGQPAFRSNSADVGIGLQAKPTPFPQMQSPGAIFLPQLQIPRLQLSAPPPIAL